MRRGLSLSAASTRTRAAPPPPSVYAIRVRSASHTERKMAAIGADTAAARLGLALGAEVAAVAEAADTGESASAAGGASAAALVGTLTDVLGDALAREARSRAWRSGARSASADLAWDSAERRRRARGGRGRGWSDIGRGRIRARCGIWSARSSASTWCVTFVVELFL